MGVFWFGVLGSCFGLVCDYLGFGIGLEVLGHYFGVFVRFVVICFGVVFGCGDFSVVGLVFFVFGLEIGEIVLVRRREVFGRVFGLGLGRF